MYSYEWHKASLAEWKESKEMIYHRITEFLPFAIRVDGDESICEIYNESSFPKITASFYDENNLLMDLEFNDCRKDLYAPGVNIQASYKEAYSQIPKFDEVIENNTVELYLAEF